MDLDEIVADVFRQERVYPTATPWSPTNTDVRHFAGWSEQVNRRGPILITITGLEECQFSGTTMRRYIRTKLYEKFKELADERWM